MKVYNDNMTLANFDAWSGAVDTKKTILEHGKGEDFDALIEELYPDGLSDTELNDFLWFEEDLIFENLGISEDEEDEDEDNEEE